MINILFFHKVGFCSKLPNIFFKYTCFQKIWKIFLGFVIKDGWHNTVLFNLFINY